MALVTWQLPLSLGEFCSPILSSRFFLRLSMAVMCLSNSFRLFYSGVIGRGWGGDTFARCSSSWRSAKRIDGKECAQFDSGRHDGRFRLARQWALKSLCIYRGRRKNKYQQRSGFHISRTGRKKYTFQKKENDVFTLLIGWITIRSVA